MFAVSFWVFKRLRDFKKNNNNKSVSDFGWLCPWVSEPGWIHYHPRSALTCSVKILRFNYEFPGLDLVPILHLGIMRLLLEWLYNVNSGTAGRFEPTTLQHCTLIVVLQSYTFNFPKGNSPNLSVNHDVEVIKTYVTFTQSHDRRMPASSPHIHWYHFYTLVRWGEYVI